MLFSCFGTTPTRAYLTMFSCVFPGTLNAPLDSSFTLFGLNLMTFRDQHGHKQSNGRHCRIDGLDLDPARLCPPQRQSPICADAVGRGSSCQSYFGKLMVLRTQFFFFLINTGTQVVMVYFTHLVASHMTHDTSRCTIPSLELLS